MNKKLKRIVKDIIFNQDISNLLDDYRKNGSITINSPYKDLVQFQIDECVKENSDILTEGYQVGEPWNGDIENAPILFLSSNPAYKFYEISPHYDIIKKLIKKAGIIIKNTDSFIEFISTRIQKSPSHDENDSVLRVPVWKGKSDVPYWSCVRERTEYLLPDDLKLQWNKKFSRKDYVREIMKYCVYGNCSF